MAVALVQSAVQRLVTSEAEYTKVGGGRLTSSENGWNASGVGFVDGLRATIPSMMQGCAAEACTLALNAWGTAEYHT